MSTARAGGGDGGSGSDVPALPGDEDLERNERCNSGFCGVHYHKNNKWFEAYICASSGRTYVGQFKTALEAARARRDRMSPQDLRQKQRDKEESTPQDAYEEDEEAPVEDDERVTVDPALAEVLKCGICLVLTSPSDLRTIHALIMILCDRVL